MTEQERINKCLNCKRPSCPRGVCPDIHDTSGGRTTISSLREQAEAIKDRNERRKFYVTHGICPYCKRRKATFGYISCGICRAKNNEKSRMRYEQRNKDKESK